MGPLRQKNTNLEYCIKHKETILRGSIGKLQRKISQMWHRVAPDGGVLIAEKISHMPSKNEIIKRVNTSSWQLLPQRNRQTRKHS